MIGGFALFIGGISLTRRKEDRGRGFLGRDLCIAARERRRRHGLGEPARGRVALAEAASPGMPARALVRHAEAGPR